MRCCMQVRKVHSTGCHDKTIHMVVEARDGRRAVAGAGGQRPQPDVGAPGFPGTAVPDWLTQEAAYVPPASSADAPVQRTTQTRLSGLTRRKPKHSSGFQQPPRPGDTSRYPGVSLLPGGRWGDDAQRGGHAGRHRAPRQGQPAILRQARSPTPMRCIPCQQERRQPAVQLCSCRSPHITQNPGRAASRPCCKRLWLP